MRVWTSMASVSQGLVMPSLFSASTTKTSMGVWSIWTTSSGRAATKLSRDSDKVLQSRYVVSFAGNTNSINASDSVADRPPVWDCHSHLMAPPSDTLDEVGQSWPFCSQVISLDLFSDNLFSLGIQRPSPCWTPPARGEQRGGHFSGAELRDEAIQCRTADPEFSRRSPQRDWIKTCSACGQKGSDDVSPTFGESPAVVAGFCFSAAFGHEPASNVARLTVPHFVQSGNGSFRISCSQSRISVELPH